MKNSLKKILTVTFMVGIITLLGACGSNNDSDTISQEEIYLSTQNVGFMSAFPESTFKQASFGTQTLELIGEETYKLTSTISHHSGELEFSDDGNHSQVPRGADVMVYYGSYTATDQDGLITIDLDKPEDIVANLSHSAGDMSIGYLNTTAWTDEMGEAAGGEEGSLSADEFLENEAFEPTTVIVDEGTASFDYIQLKPELGE